MAALFYRMALTVSHPEGCGIGSHAPAFRLGCSFLTPPLAHGTPGDCSRLSRVQTRGPNSAAPSQAKPRIEMRGAAKRLGRGRPEGHPLRAGVRLGLACSDFC